MREYSRGGDDHHFRRSRLRHDHEQFQRRHHLRDAQAMGRAEDEGDSVLRRCWAMPAGLLRRARRLRVRASACLPFLVWEHPAASISCWRTAPAAALRISRATADELLAAARQRPELGSVVSTFRDTVPEYEVSVDTDKAQTLGIPVSDVYDSLQTYLGGLYVNDFNRFGRTWKVLMQADAEYRDQASDINRFYVRSAQSEMVPLGTLVTFEAGHRAGDDLPLQPLPRHRNSGAGCAGSQFRRSRGGDGAGGENNSPARLRLRMDRHRLPAKARGRQGRLHVRAGGGAGVPASGRAV